MKSITPNPQPSRLSILGLSDFHYHQYCDKVGTLLTHASLQSVYFRMG